jgi:putative oxidoreductase
MERIIGRFSPHAYALLRIVAGLMFAMHGTQKILGWPASNSPGPLPTMALVAGWIELVCGALIMIGLLTGWAAFLASGEMAGAYFMVHAKNAFWPIENQGELAALYCFVFLYVATVGAGIWSVDSVMKPRARA